MRFEDALNLPKIYPNLSELKQNNGLKKETGDEEKTINFGSQELDENDECFISIYESSESEEDKPDALLDPISKVEASSDLRSFMLLDTDGSLELSLTSFVKNFGGCTKRRSKIVSIFGKAGDGKSHTMNHTFFDGEDVFQTSCEQKMCTRGVQAAFQRSTNTLCLDTEGLPKITLQDNKCIHTLLKVLAMSDVVIYRTRSEMLHSDMFKFLGLASKSIVEYIANGKRPIISHRPAIIIFHETRNTRCLQSRVGHSAEDILREQFAKMDLNLDGFRSIKYVGTRTASMKTGYSSLRDLVTMELEIYKEYPSQTLGVIYRTLKDLELVKKCAAECRSCRERCQRFMGHDGQEHLNSEQCQYRPLFGNKVMMCNACYTKGRKVVVIVQGHDIDENVLIRLAKYAWSGEVIECPNCGEIYRSRQYWYGQKPPESAAVRSEAVHVWEYTWKYN